MVVRYGQKLEYAARPDVAKYRPSQLAEEVLLGIAEYPYLSQTVDHIREGCRRSVCGKHSIYYRTAEQGEENMGVLGRQDPKENLTKRPDYETIDIREKVRQGNLTKIFRIWNLKCGDPVIFSFAVFLCIPESYLDSLFATLAYISIISFGFFGSIPSGRHSTPPAFRAVWLGAFSCSFSITAFDIPD